MNDIIPKVIREAKQKKTPYKRPQSVKDLQEQHTAFKYAGRSIPYQVKTKLRDDDANSLAGCLKAWADVNDAFFQRNNSQGQYDAKLNRWRKSGSTSGVADCQITYKGHTLNIEIKIGRDRMSDKQKKVRDQIQAAGGHYAVITCFDDFLTQITNL